MKRVTLKDIAKECGCSVTTVTRALNDSPTISLAMRSKIKRTSEELGYIPNLSATSIRTGSSNAIGIIMQDFRSPFFPIMAHYIDEYAAQLGYHTLFLTSHYNMNTEINAIKTLIGQNIDGVLLFPVQTDTRSIKLLEQYHIPFVLVGRKFENTNYNAVFPNDYQGAYDMTKHLLSKGHRKVLFLNTFMDNYSAINRYNGYRDAMADAGIEVLESDHKQLSLAHMQGYNMTREIFQEKKDYTAVFSFCDLLSSEVISCLRNLHYHIPEDVAVYSIDGTYVDIAMPIHITSAYYDKQAMTTMSLDLLCEQIKLNKMEMEHSPKEIMLPMSLDLGETG